MSRVHEAMKRAAAEKEPEEPGSSVGQARSDLVFLSPWQFDTADAGHSSHAQRPVVSPALGPVPVQGRPQATPVPALGLVTRERREPDGRGEQDERPSLGGAAPASAVRLDSLLAMHWPQPFSPHVAGKLVVMPDADPQAIAQYRALAARLQEIQADRGGNVLLVTSALAGEGKTLTATNLCLTLAEGFGRRVLLLDAHVRRPEIHRLFQVSAGKGIAGGMGSAIEVTRGLTLLPAGRTAPEPAFAPQPEALSALLAEARPAFDWIVLDGPAIAEMSEVRLLVEPADLVLLIASAETVPDALEAAVDRVGRRRLAGVVLNRMGTAPDSMRG